MKLIVGLGNPGARYAATRHNVGFMVADCLARRWRLRFSRLPVAVVARGRLRDQAVVLIEPLTFMNCSGEALAELDPELQLASGDLIVVHDDLDLARGRVAIKAGGGTGGHRGIASITERRGPDFVRVRVGIGRPGEGRDPVTYVLEPFDTSEREVIDPAIERAADAVEAIIADGVVRAMNRFNTRSAAVDPSSTPQRRE